MSLKENVFKKKLNSAEALKSPKQEKKFILDERQVDVIKDQSPLFADLPVTDKLNDSNESVTSTQAEHNATMLLEMLPDLEKSVVLFVLSKLTEFNLNGVLVKNNELLEASSMTSPALRNVISRLKAKGVLEIVKTRPGPGGWRIFKINDRYSAK